MARATPEFLEACRRAAVDRGSLQAVLIDPFVACCRAVQAPVVATASGAITFDGYRMAAVLGMRELAAMTGGAQPRTRFATVRPRADAADDDEVLVAVYLDPGQPASQPCCVLLGGVVTTGYGAGGGDGGGSRCAAGAVLPGRALVCKMIKAHGSCFLPLDLADVEPLVRWHDAAVARKAARRNARRLGCVRCGARAARDFVCAHCRFARCCADPACLAYFRDIHPSRCITSLL